MRRIKKFYETHNDDIVQKDYISPDELEAQLNSALNLDDFEASTKMIRSIKDDYPYIKNQSPYKEIYNDFLKEWHDKFKHDLKYYKPEK